MPTTIQEIVASVGASLSSPPVTPDGFVSERAELSRAIASSYPAFETLRDGLLDRRSLEVHASHLPMLELAGSSGLVHHATGTWRIGGNDARRYLTGGWLEEYVALAVRETGADEVLIGQKLRWREREYTGENEIDVLARFGSRLFMCSCKALKSALLPEDVRTRERLMHALHEADNLADHFAPSGGIVALAVTTDLMDERARLVRYQQLHGKAAVLGVSLMTLEHMPWPEIVKRLRLIVAGAHVTV